MFYHYQFDAMCSGLVFGFNTHTSTSTQISNYIIVSYIFYIIFTLCQGWSTPSSSSSGSKQYFTWATFTCQLLPAYIFHISTVFVALVISRIFNLVAFIHCKHFLCPLSQNFSTLPRIIMFKGNAYMQNESEKMHTYSAIYFSVTHEVKIFTLISILLL